MSPTVPQDARKWRLILLFGLPRSGTTWLGKIFDSHADTLYRHEPDSQFRLSGIPLLPDTAEQEQFRTEIDRFIQNLTGIRSPKVCAKLPFFPKSYYSDFRFALFRMGVLAAKSAERIAPDVPVLPFVNYQAVTNLSVVWKSIESLGRLGTIMHLFPETRSIILIRNPCGYVASVLRGEAKGSFVSRTPASEDWGIFEKLLATRQARMRGLTISKIQGLKPVERLAWRWLLFNEKALDDVADVRNSKFVRYEDLCANPESVAKQLFEHARLPWSSQTADFLTRSTAAEDGSYYSVFKNPGKAVNRWRKELSPDDVERIHAVVRDSKPGRLYAAPSLD